LGTPAADFWAANAGAIATANARIRNTTQQVFMVVLLPESRCLRALGFQFDYAAFALTRL
jgi:hypothetical protein